MVNIDLDAGYGGHTIKCPNTTLSLVIKNNIKSKIFLWCVINSQATPYFPSNKDYYYISIVSGKMVYAMCQTLSLYALPNYCIPFCCLLFALS